MQHFVVDDPNFGLRHVTESMLEHGFRSTSRNGPVIRFVTPTLIEYTNPRRRILDWEVRDANHFFHHVETMWMFAGMDEVAPLEFFNGQIKQYSDDGHVLRGTAYGQRWYQHFGFDQIHSVVQRLRKDPSDRRAVLTMWDPREMLTTTQDYACNMQVIFSAAPDGDGGHRLDMTVTNRSNDLIYGAMGSNMFHFSMLHELVAKEAGIPLGSYYQFSTNLHIYTENPATQKVIQAVKDGVVVNPSPQADHSFTELSGPDESLNKTAFYRNLVKWGQPTPKEGDYIAKVARPMMEAYRLFKGKSILGDSAPTKEKRRDLAQEILSEVPSPLGVAGINWLGRKMK